MKKTLFIILNVFISQLLTGQAENEKEPVTDPFCRMIKTIYSFDELRFNSQVNTKQVFETDTVTTYAHVIVKKKGTNINFLQIIPEAGEKELLFCNDSGWVVDHQRFNMECIGTSADQLTHNSMSSFFSFTLFSVDTLISRVEPYWRVIDKTTDYSIVSMDINKSSNDVSDIRVEFTIGNADFLPYKTFQEYVYMKADKMMQEQIFSDYTFPGPGVIRVPDYFYVYGKDLGYFDHKENITDDDDAPEDIYLDDIALFDFSGNPVNLPDKGLILFDLWYVGCPPCMKSAPVLEELYGKYKEQVYFFSVNEMDQDTEKITRFKEKMGLTFPVLLGEKGKIAPKVTGTSGYPVFILFDAQSRKVLWNSTGYREDLEELIENAIEQNL